MGKDYDGGISTGSLAELMTKATDLQTALNEMFSALVLEENQSSLVDQDKVKAVPGKCGEIKTKRQAVDDLIGSAASGQGVVVDLAACSESVASLIDAVNALNTTYEGVAVQPTGAAGHC